MTEKGVSIVRIKMKFLVSSPEEEKIHRVVNKPGNYEGGDHTHVYLIGTVTKDYAGHDLAQKPPNSYTENISAWLSVQQLPIPPWAGLIFVTDPCCQGSLTHNNLFNPHFVCKKFPRPPPP